MADAQEQSAEGRLIGWKRIASYLGCSERTARRWEAAEALPIHRQMHEAKSTVFALPRELDGWIASRAPAEAGTVARERPRVAMAAAAAAVIILVLGAIFLWPTNHRNAALPLSEDVVALDLYERGVSLWRQRGPEPNARAVRILTEAVERDPDFAEAWAALASAWATLPTYVTDVEPRQASDQAMMAAERALSLDPTLAEPRTLMVSIAQRQGDWARSEQIFREALAAEPNNPTILIWFAGHYRELGMFEEANRLSEEARALDPNAPPVLTEIAMNTLQAGQVEEGEALIDFLLENMGLETPIAWMGKFFALIQREDWDAAHAWIDRTPFPYTEEAMHAYAEAERAGTEEMRARAIAVINEAYGSGATPWICYFMLDRLRAVGPALDIVEAEEAAGGFSTSVVMFDPDRPAARKTERFKELAEGMGFLRYWKEAGPPTFCTHEPDTPVCRALDVKQE